MNLNNLFEGAVDDLEKRRIEDLEAKMDDLAARGRVAHDDGNHELYNAIKREWEKCKAERNSYYYVKEAPGAETLAHNEKTAQSNLDAFDLEEHGGGVNAMKQYVSWRQSANKERGITSKQPVGSPAPKSKSVPKGSVHSKLDQSRGVIPTSSFHEEEMSEHGGGGGGPRQWHAYVKAHRANEAANPAQQAAIAIAKKKEQGVDEGWSNKMVARRTGQAPTPYSVFISGKEWKSFPDDDYAENVANKLRAKFKEEGRDPSVITIAPTDYDKDIKEEGWSINPEHLKGPRSMKAAAAKPTGPKFSGYLKGTDPAPNEYTNKGVGGCEEAYEPITKPVPQPKKLNPGWALHPTTKAELKRRKDARNRVGVDEMGHRDPGGFVNWARKQGQRFAGFLHDPEIWNAAQTAYSQEFAEGAKVDRMQKHIAKSERGLGKSKKDAEAIAWATLNKRGYLDNANKKDESVDNSRATNFISWVLSQGSRFQGFTANPETYAKAKEAYKREHGAEAHFAEGMSNALSNITRRIAQPVNAQKLIKNREQKKDSLKRQHFAEDEQLDEDLMSLFGEAQNIFGIYQFLKSNGLPVALFVAAVLAYGLHNTLRTADEDKNTFIKAAKAAWNKVDHGKVEKAVAWLNSKFADAIEKMKFDDPNGYVPDLTEIKKGQKDSNGNTGCWDGYHAAGTKKGKNGGQVRNCVPNESIEEDWQKANKKDKTDGMSKKAVKAYRRENPGSKLQTAVTTKPSKLKKGSKASKRRKSYCARSAGQKKMHNIDCSKTPDKAICKARRRWNCESQEQFDAMLREAVEKSELQPGQYYVWTVYFDDGSNKKIKVTKDTFDPKAYYAKQNKVVVNVDYDWVPHGA